jgi:hypothetical protein
MKIILVAVLFTCLTTLTSTLAQEPRFAQLAGPPNVSGLYVCRRYCQRQTNQPYILQTGSHLFCGNDVGAGTTGDLYYKTKTNNGGTSWGITCWSTIRDGGFATDGEVFMNRDGSVSVIHFDHVERRSVPDQLPVLYWHTYSEWQPLRPAAAPNFSGHFYCTGNCSGDTTLSQEGFDVICINDARRDSDSHGKVTGPRTFDGCWGLHAVVSDDASQIDWNNHSIWIRKGSVWD